MLTIADFADRKEEFLSLLQRLVQTESPTWEKAAVDRVGALIAEELGLSGAEIEFDRQVSAGDHLIGHWKVDHVSKDGILLLCHMDTVHPSGSLQENPCVLQDGKLFGPGVQDMKSGIAIVLGVAKILKEAHHWPSRPITALFTSDEETGSETSRSLIESLARQASLVLCLEPSMPDGSIKTWRKGVGEYEVIARGRAAHAGADHAEGRNAIEELAYGIIQIQKWTDYPRGTTLNVGLVQGGSASNVVPAEARAVVDFRVSQPEEAERVRELMQSLRPTLEGTTIEARGGLNRPPMPRDQLMVETFQRAQRIAGSLGLELREGGTGGGSDANFVAPLGVRVLDGLGAVGEGQHSEREHIQVASLAERAALLAALLTEW